MACCGRVSSPSGSSANSRNWRARTSLVRQRAQVVHRIKKVLEGANVKLSAVATDVTGVSGRAMLDAIVAGEENPEALARLAWGRLQRKQAQLVAALQGWIGAHQRCLLASLLRQLDFLEAEIDHLSTELARRLRPWEAVLERLDTIPGVGRRAAEHLVAEFGPDVSRFPTAAYLASWARLCPGNHESAGKRQSGAIGHGNPWLRAILVKIAWAAARTRHTYLAAQYRRLAARRGAKRALIALAHTILIIVYHPLRDDGVYQDLGENYCDERARQQVVRRTVRRLERLAYEVTVEAA